MALLQIDTMSQALGRTVTMNVILPSADTPAPWKTLYLLHGFSDDYSIWERRTSIERYADAYGIAVIMPTTGIKWYTDTWMGENYFTYISDELIKITRRMFPKLSRDRSDTYVAGLSMGGYGAVKCALSRPDIFSRAASLSGALDVHHVRTSRAGIGSEVFWEDIFGPETSPKDDIAALATNLTENRPELFIWCGTEDFLYPVNLRMRDRLKALGYNLAYSESAGIHDWFYWDREIRNVLRWIFGEGEYACR